eukprot:6207632-Pleurochrysis_carterae.AAC.1
MGYHIHYGFCAIAHIGSIEVRGRQVCLLGSDGRDAAAGDADVVSAFGEEVEEQRDEDCEADRGADDDGGDGAARDGIVLRACGRARRRAAVCRCGAVAAGCATRGQW